MKKKTAYIKFKNQALSRCDGICENPCCDAEADQLHHFLRTSIFPEFKMDLDNVMGICSTCHSEIERRIREQISFKGMIPYDRFLRMGMKI